MNAQEATSRALALASTPYQQSNSRVDILAPHSVDCNQHKGEEPEMSGNTGTHVKARDLEVGDVVLDGIASRIDYIVKHDDLGEVYIGLTDGNGYGGNLRLDYDAPCIRFEDWTDEDWQAFREL